MSGHRAAELLICACVYRCAWKRVGLRRPFFMEKNDTHGGADEQFDRTQTKQETEYVNIKEETNHGKPDDPHQTEGV